VLRRALIGGAASVALAAVGCGGGGGPALPSASLGGAVQRPEIGRNVVRVPGLSPSDRSAAAVLASYDPRNGAKPPGGWVLVPDDDWHDLVLAAQFAAAPVSAGILAIDRNFIPTAPGDVLSRIPTKGFPKAAGLKVLVVDRVGDDVYVDLQDLGLKPTALFGDPATLAGKLVPFRGGWAGAYSDSIEIVSADARDYALPAAAWSAYSGDTVAFVHRNSIPAATRALLVQRQKLRVRKPSVYVIGPPSVISNGVLTRLGRYASSVHRVAGSDAAGTAVALARYHDPQTGFGWGLRRGPASVSIVNTADWQDAIGALTYAATGPQAPLLLTNSSTSLPPAVESYLGQLRGRKPSQAWVLGGRTAVGMGSFQALDGLLARRG
jgi:hypothetical protein